MSYEVQWVDAILLLVFLGLIFIFPWLLVAWHLRLIKAVAWKWILSLGLVCLALLVFVCSAFYVSGVTPGAVVAPLVALFILIGISLGLLFPFIWRAARLGKVDSLRGKQVLGAILVYFVTQCFFFYSIGFIGSTKARVALDHSINLPYSVSHIECEDLFTFTPFADAGASASFEIKRKDLGAILAQFREVTLASKPEGNSDTALTRPAGFKRPIASYTGLSRDGNVFSMEVYDMDVDHVYVVIDTSWN